MHSVRQRSLRPAPGTPPPLPQLVEDIGELAVQGWHFIADVDEVDEVAALQSWRDRDYDAASDLELLAQLRDRVDQADWIGVR